MHINAVLSSANMHQFRRRSTADKRPSRSDRALSGLTGLVTDRKNSVSSSVADIDGDFSDEREDFKGPLGLNLLHSVPEPLVDLIFIHGLGGGSRKTWSKSPDPYHYWPKEWLSRDPEFSCVRVHSFGYKADWAERKSSFLNIQDFSLALLGEIQCSPEIRRSDVRPLTIPQLILLWLINHRRELFLSRTAWVGSSQKRYVTLGLRRLVGILDRIQ